MSTQAPNQSQLDNATLIEQVSYPVFFQKMASVGYNCKTPEAANELTKLAGQVSTAVESYLARTLNAQDATKEAAVRHALSAAGAVTEEISGVRRPTSPTVEPQSFLADPNVKSAVERVAAERIKAAGLADLVPGATKEDEELDADGNPKKKDPMAASA